MKFKNNVTFITNLVPESKYSLKCPFAMNAEGVTVHNTANRASAANEISYMINNNSSTSYHFCVDESQIIQAIPLNRNAWHAGDENGAGNRKTIGIEIARSTHEDESLFNQAEENAAELVANICKERGWGVDKVYTHQHWSGKRCPHKTLDKGWERFLNLVRKYLDQAEVPVTPPVKPTTPVETPVVNATYAVMTEDGRILPEVTNLEDYAGLENVKIKGIAMKVDKGYVKYQVHVLGGAWLPWVDGYNWKDAINGYAGNGKVIDAIRIYYETPADIVKQTGRYYKAKYRTSQNKSANYYDWQLDDEKTSDMDGYAGLYGKPIDKVQICIE